MGASPIIYFSPQLIPSDGDGGDDEASAARFAYVEIACRRQSPYRRIHDPVHCSPCSLPLQTFKVTVRARVPLALAPKLPHGRCRVLVPTAAAVRDTVSVLEGRKGEHTIHCMAAAYMIGHEEIFRDAKEKVLRSLDARCVIRVGYFGLAWDDFDLVAAAYRWLARYMPEQKGEMLFPLIIEDNGGIRDEAGYRLTYQDLVLAATKIYSLSPLAMKTPDKCVGQVRRGTASNSFELWLAGRAVLHAAWCAHDGEYVVVVPPAGEESAPIDRQSRGFVGSITMNMGGTEFAIYDAGCVSSPSTSDDRESFAIPGHTRVALARIEYKTNMFGSCPRRFFMVLDPSFNERGDRKPISLINNPPIWNPVYGAHTLDFGSAAKLPSKKNFQMIDPDHAGRILLQLGKLAPSTFHIDFVSPFSPLTAFGLVVSSMVNKRLVT